MTAFTTLSCSSPLCFNLKCFCVQGASFGQWRLPWGAVERHDSIAVLDWMTGQPWCNGKVLLLLLITSYPDTIPPPLCKFTIQLCVRLLLSPRGLFACGAAVT